MIFHGEFPWYSDILWYIPWFHVRYWFLSIPFYSDGLVATHQATLWAAGGGLGAIDGPAHLGEQMPSRNAWPKYGESKQKMLILTWVEAVVFRFSHEIHLMLSRNGWCRHDFFTKSSPVKSSKVIVPAWQKHPLRVMAPRAKWHVARRKFGCHRVARRRKQHCATLRSPKTWSKKVKPTQPENGGTSSMGFEWDFTGNIIVWFKWDLT